MLRLKSCPRCRGDIYIESATYGNYEKCLQCGWEREIEPVVQHRDWREILKEVEKVKV
jgi:hypothetical protein